IVSVSFSNPCIFILKTESLLGSPSSSSGHDSFCWIPLSKYRASYLTKLASVVSKNSGEKIDLNKYKFRVGSLEDTSYKNNTDILQEWEQFYLEQQKKMVVIGVLENFPCGEDSAELVLMVCEDERVFAYEDEHLHLVASSLEVLFESGVQFPSSEYYYRGQSFEKMVKQSKKVTAKFDEHREMLQSLKPTLLKHLGVLKQ
uniref:Uncharacterized protein n=1 Tax=Astyanax mexicanus TaxID=7994 RepID=A0A3B1IL56_ASTMX